MNSELRNREFNTSEGRPYRSHLHPACFPCRARKSRCKTRHESPSCVMCQAHGTECVFPRAAERPRRTPGHSSRKSQPRPERTAPSPGNPAADLQCLTSSYPSLSPHGSTLYQTPPSDHTLATNGTRSDYLHCESQSVPHDDSNSALMIDFIAKSDQGSSHVISPAIAEDDKVFQEYLSNTPYGKSGRMVRFHLNSKNPQGPPRPIVFNTFPKRGQRETESRSLATSEYEEIEKIVGPYQHELIDLFFEKVNMCFPIFDEPQFRRVFMIQKEHISPGLLSMLYSNTLVFWDTSPALQNVPCPEFHPIFIRAENAMNAEWLSTPGMSTIITIILNLSARPSTHILGNGRLVGMAVALANAFGLNRDPSGWNLSPTEKKFRIRIWRLLVVYDRWCSLAYGTPPLIHSAQHDVPIPTVEDLYDPGASSNQILAAACFVALTTLTEVLGHCLEHIYHLDDEYSDKPEASPFRLEGLLTEWEDSLSDNVRRLVIRGTGLVGPGAANLRLAYLSVKLLIRRSQLNVDTVSLRLADVDSMYYTLARRASEEIVDFVRELDETQCRDFWIPFNTYTITSATTFLMRCALTSRGMSSNPSIQLARSMINALQSHRHNYSWDLADNCLSNFGELIEKIEAACEASSSNTLDFQEPMPMDMDILALNGLFSDFTEAF